MAIIICPECGKELSSYAKDCIKCGFPIKEYMTENGLVNINKEFICPKCGFHSAGFGESGKDNIYIKCKYCNTNMIQTDETGDEFVDNFCTYSVKGEDYFKIFAKKYGGDQFSEEAYEDRIRTVKRENSARQSTQVTQPSNVPHCPVCNSTNIEKISLGKKAKGSFLFGFFSSDVRNQMHCKDCGYKF